MTFQVVDGSQFTHLSTDLPLPTGSGVPRGATSQELDTGRVLRYEYASQTWYVVSGGGGTGTGGAGGSGSVGGLPDSGNTSTTNTSILTSQQLAANDYELRSTLHNIEIYLRAIAHALSIVVDADDVNALIDDAGDSGTGF